jgi:predicted nucleic acid-binding protein
VAIDLVYVDSCALQRLFDRVITARQQNEARAIARLYEAVELSIIQMAWSFVLEYENVARIPPSRKDGCIAIRSLATIHVRAPTEAIYLHARQVAQELRLEEFDALHLACAESVGATFVTVDQKILKRTAGAAMVRVPVMDPVAAVTCLGTDA